LLACYCLRLPCSYLPTYSLLLLPPTPSLTWAEVARIRLKLATALAVWLHQREPISGRLPRPALSILHLEPSSCKSPVTTRQALGHWKAVSESPLLILSHPHPPFATTTLLFIQERMKVLRSIVIACETKLQKAVSVSSTSPSTSTTTTTSDDDAERLHGSTSTATASRYARRNVIQWRGRQWWDEQWGEWYVISQCLLFPLYNACELSFGVVFLLSCGVYKSGLIHCSRRVDELQDPQQLFPTKNRQTQAPCMRYMPEMLRSFRTSQAP